MIFSEVIFEGEEAIKANKQLNNAQFAIMQTDNGNRSLKNGIQYLNDRDEMNYSCEKKVIMNAAKNIWSSANKWTLNIKV